MFRLNQGYNTYIVTTEKMRLIEEEIFAKGMPIASLMEKAALLTSQQIQKKYPLSQFNHIGVIAGCGHNGGDSLVIARELFLNGYFVQIYSPLAEKCRDLTAQHLKYAQEIGINFVKEIEELSNCDLIIDGLFGFGITRDIEGKLAQIINKVNHWQKPIISIDIPSGIDTDTGIVRGNAIKATHTFCLGLWKQGLFQELALEYVGKIEKIDFGIPKNILNKFLTDHNLQLISPTMAKECLPLTRPINTHKYKQGHLLLICGSQQYAGAALLSAYGAISSGVGMLSVAVPNSLKSLINAQIPSALVIPCPENDQGEITSLPKLDFSKYQAISCGMGLTSQPEKIIQTIIEIDIPVILDADALNIIAKNQYLFSLLLKTRKTEAIITPHQGEFNRLFPELSLKAQENRILNTQKAAESTNTIILLKGARTIITNPQSKTFIIADSTPALARGGSGDVLSGLLGGLVAQQHIINQPLLNIVSVGAWLHQQAGILARQNHTEMGVSPRVLAKYINLALKLLERKSLKQ